MRNRAYRRHQRRRRMAAEYRKWVNWNPYSDVEAAREHARNTAQYHHSHRTICSCMGCGNPRKWFKKLTIQEKKAPKIDDF